LATEIRRPLDEPASVHRVHYDCYDLCDGSNHRIGKKMVDTPKVVFTKTISKSEWENTVIAKGNLADEISQLKNQEGKDIIVYEGLILFQI
jgi:dihydrofolate reductase